MIKFVQINKTPIIMVIGLILFVISIIIIGIFNGGDDVNNIDGLI